MKMHIALLAFSMLLAAPATRAERPPNVVLIVTLEQINDTARRVFARGAALALVGGPGE